MTSCRPINTQCMWKEHPPHVDLRHNLCAFLSQPHQANPHFIRSRNLRLAGISCSYIFLRPCKSLPPIPIKSFRTRSSYLTRRGLSSPRLRSLTGNAGFGFLDLEIFGASSASALAPQGNDVGKSFLFMTNILNDITITDLLSFTFVSTALVIIAAYIAHEVKHYGTEDSSPGPLEHHRSDSPSDDSARRVLKYDQTETPLRWLQISKPSPFNHAVSGRCPSLSSSMGNLRGIQSGGKLKFGEREYQRECLSAYDGGTVALDWPSHLELDGNKELENILLLVCGTTEGSNEDGIRKLSQLVEQHGYFPVVLNPRGCGGSPLTTPRVFSALDSDDVRLAVHFLAKSRPWATIMAIGWGFGANMLVKYLAEEGSGHPLTAAVCIDTPFNLYDATKPIAGSRWLEFVKSMTRGLVHILDSNKMLFQGAKKGFDVTRALAATSLQDFDTAITCVVHGYDSLQALYTNASCRGDLEKVQIPVLCIQHIQDYRGSGFSLPHLLFERNAYVTLLVPLFDTKMYKPSSLGNDDPGTASEWYHDITLEWLTAVEISLLKGRHPLSTNIIPILKQLNEWQNVNHDDGVSSKTGAVGASGTDSHTEDAFTEIADENERPPSLTVRHPERAAVEATSKDDKLSAESTGGFDNGGSINDAQTSDNTDADNEVLQQPLQEDTDDSEEAERGQVVQVAGSVMKVLDVTMPGTLSDVQKEQVLKAVGKGETLVTALEEAVPEDVRGKMAAAVSEAVQAQGLSLRLVGFGKAMPAPKLSNQIKESIQGKLAGLRNIEAPDSVVMNTEDKVSTGGTQDDGDAISNEQPKGGGQQDGDRLEKGTVELKNYEDLASSQNGELLKNTHNLGSQQETCGADVGEKERGISGSDQKEKSVYQQDKLVPQNSSDKGIYLQSEVATDRLNKSLDDKSTDNFPKVEHQSQTNGVDGEKIQEQLEVPAAMATDGSHKARATSRFEDPKQEQGFPSDRKENDTKVNKDPNDSEGEAVGRESEKVDTRDPGTQGPQALQTGTGNLASIPHPSPPSVHIPQSSAASTETSDSVPDSQSSRLQTNQSTAPSAVVSAGPQSSQSPSSEISQPASPGASEYNGASSEVPTPSTSSPQSPQSDAPSLEPAAAAVSSPQQNPPSQFPSMGAALQALTGFDDSTQMAVTNVFGVVENVLDQLEKDRPSTDANGRHATENQSPLESDGSLCVSTQSTTEMTDVVGDDRLNPSDSDGNKEKGAGIIDEQSTSVREGNVSATDTLMKEKYEVLGKQQVDNRLKLKGMQTPVEVGVLNYSSCEMFDTGSVKPFMNVTERGHIKVDSNQELGDVIEHPFVSLKDEIRGSPAGQQSYPIPAQSSLDLRENSRSSLEVSGSSIPAESAYDRRLEVMAAEIEAENGGTAEFAADDRGTGQGRGINFESDDSNVVADLVMNALKLEVVRRLGGAGLEVLDIDLEAEAAKVACAVSGAVTVSKNKLFGEVSDALKISQESGPEMGGKQGVLNGSNVITALASVLGSNSVLGRLVPFGVLAGVVMAALGAVYLIVSDDQDDETTQAKKRTSQNESQLSPSSSQKVGSNSTGFAEELGRNFSDTSSGAYEGCEVSDSLWQDNENPNDKHSIARNMDEGLGKLEGKSNVCDADNCSDVDGKGEVGKLPEEGKLLGTVAAAMGATAAMASQSQASTTANVSNGQAYDSETNVNGKHKSVAEIAGKAISVVSPVVPKTEDGEVDHERLVAMLTEVGQRGGPLTLIGKAALLWGGLRGAMNLADRLLSFFRMRERPLQQRLLGFGGMAVLLWTPVLVPLLPTLLQQWATKGPSGVADAAAGIGLYGAVFLLVTIWGRRVRGYERPLVAYGLQLFSSSKTSDNCPLIPVALLVFALRLQAIALIPVAVIGTPGIGSKLQYFTGGMSIGLGLVTSYYGISWALGYARVTWDAVVVKSPVFPGMLASTILTSWRVMTLVGQSLAMAVAVALVEEVLFRAWLQEEIAVDLGYHWGIFLSALAFAVVHWSPPALAGLWLLAVALSGARAKTGDLSLPVGIHAGIVSAFSVMNIGGLVHYLPDAPTWFTGAYAGNPLAGALGLVLVAILAIALYPRTRDFTEKDSRL